MNAERINSFQQTAKYFKMKYATEWAEVQRKLQEGKTVAELLTPEQVGAQNDSKALSSIAEPAQTGRDSHSEPVQAGAEQGARPPDAGQTEPPPASVPSGAGGAESKGQPKEMK